MKLLLLNTLALEHTLIQQISSVIAEYAARHTLTKQISSVIAKYASQTYSNQTNK